MNFRLNSCDAYGFRRPGVTHERGQDAGGWPRAICASHGVRAVEDRWPHHRTPRGQRWCSYLGLRRFVSCDGFRTNYVAGILARYRGVTASQTRQAFSQGTPRRARSTLSDALDLRDWRIHGPRPPRQCFGDAPDRACAGTLHHGTAGDRSGRDGLRARCDHDRFVSKLVRLCPFSFDQSRSHAAHAAGFARCYS